MTGRERLERVIDGQPTDRACLHMHVDDIIRSQMPPEWRDIPVLEFYRKMGYDHMQFGNYRLPKELHPVVPYTLKCDYTEETEKRGEIGIKRRTYNGKSLEIHTKHEHPVKYPVVEEEDLELLCEMWESTEIEEKTGKALEESLASYARVDAAIGDMGIYAPTVDQSAVQHLLEYEIGVENFYYLLEDAPELMERTIEAIQRVRQKTYEIMAKNIPCKTIIPVENTSTTMISPTLYRKYTLPHMQAYSETMHKYGKKAIIHMCGHLRHLLPELKAVGLDGIDALTPPPVGDCPYDAALDALGENLVVHTGLNRTILHDPALSWKEKAEALRKDLSPRMLAGNFTFKPGVVTGRPSSVEYLEHVRDIMFELGKK